MKARTIWLALLLLIVLFSLGIQCAKKDKSRAKDKGKETNFSSGSKPKDKASKPMKPSLSPTRTDKTLTVATKRTREFWGRKSIE